MLCWSILLETRIEISICQPQHVYRCIYKTNPDNSKAFDDYIQILNRGPIAWLPKSQSTVAKSTCKAELMASSYSRQTIPALKDVGVIHAKQVPLLHTDNQPALNLIQNRRVTAPLKHITIHYHVMREGVRDVLNITHFTPEDNLANVCTKALPKVHENVCMIIFN